MKRRVTRVTRVATAIMAGAATMVLAVGPANAGTATGATQLLGPAVAGSHLLVDVSIVSATPVVAYEYRFRNECKFQGTKGGRASSVQSDPIVDWVFSSDSASVPHATMDVDLTSIPAGAACSASLLKGNTLVKGSVTTYSVS